MWCPWTAEWKVNFFVFGPDNFEKLDQKSILSQRCRKFKQKRRYDKWNFAFFRLDKCERWQQLSCRCFETLIVCPCLFIAIQLYWNFKLYCFYFFPKSAPPNWGCGLSTDAAYTQMFTVTKNKLRICSFWIFHLKAYDWLCKGKKLLWKFLLLAGCNPIALVTTMTIIK